MIPEDQKRIHITPSAIETKFSRHFLTKEAQTLTYPGVYKALENNQPIPEKSSLIKLNPTLTPYHAGGQI